MHQIVNDLRAEQAALDALLAPLSAGQWLAPTPAAGWDVRDSVSHLAVIDELALLCVRGDGRAGAEELQRLGSSGRTPDELTRDGADRGLARGPAEMLEWWRGTRERLNDELLAKRADDRVPWGAGPMSARSFATARLMECWAHGLDCFAAVGADPVDTDRIRHVCHLGYRALPYAFVVAGRPMPAPLAELRLDLVGSDGTAWLIGAPAAPNVVSGQAGEWARVAVQRMRIGDAHTLEASGALARQALEVARAFV